MFNKIWQNSYGKEYLVTLSSSLCEVPIFPRQYISLLLSHLSQKSHEETLKAALSAVNKVRSKEYSKLGSESPYLYY